MGRGRRLIAHLALPLAVAGLTALYMLPFIRPPTGREALDGSDLVNQQYPLFSLVFDPR